MSRRSVYPFTLLALAAAIGVAVIVAFGQQDRDAIYISAGDGTQWGCCGDRARSASALFARRLSDETGDEVRWETVASGYETTDSFVNGLGAAEPQLVRLERLLHDRRTQRIRAITLSIGGNDLVEVGRECQGGESCTDIYLRKLAELRQRLDAIYTRVNRIKPRNTPLLVLIYYNASDCGQPGVDSSPAELGVRGWNDAIREIAEQHGAYAVDAYTPVRGRACEYVTDLDLNERGHAMLAEQYWKTYEQLPAALR